jgi:hypothetical protein
MANAPPPPPPPTTPVLSNSAALVETFNGTSRPSVEVFVKSIERAAALSNYSEVQQLGLAKLKMRGAALEYLESDTVLDIYVKWDDFKKALLERYQEKISVANATNMLANCMQKSGETVADYVTRLRVIGVKILQPCTVAKKVLRVKMLDEQLCAQLLRGLKDDIRRFVLSREPADLKEAIRIARLEEQNALTTRRVIAVVSAGVASAEEAKPYPPVRNFPPNRDAMPSRTFTNRPFNPSREYNPNKSYAQAAGQVREVPQQQNWRTSEETGKFCRSCKLRSHWTKHCPTYPNNCWFCGFSGHLSRFCPKRNQPPPPLQIPVQSVATTPVDPNEWTL